MSETETALEEVTKLPPLAKPKPRVKRRRATRAKIDEVWILATSTGDELHEKVFLTEEGAKAMAKLASDLFHRQDCTVRRVEVWRP